MHTATPAQKRRSLLPFGIGLLVLVFLAVIASQRGRALLTRQHDNPPVIEFSWSPAEGPVSLAEASAVLHISDDYGIDFTTYRMRLVELDRTLDFPVEGVVGKDWTQPVSFSLVADDPKLQDVHTLTVEISVADDRGQVSTLTKVIPLK